MPEGGSEQYTKPELEKVSEEEFSPSRILEELRNLKSVQKGEKEEYEPEDTKIVSKLRELEAIEQKEEENVINKERLNELLDEYETKSEAEARFEDWRFLKRTSVEKIGEEEVRPTQKSLKDTLNLTREQARSLMGYLYDSNIIKKEGRKNVLNRDHEFVKEMLDLKEEKEKKEEEIEPETDSEETQEEQGEEETVEEKEDKEEEAETLGDLLEEKEEAKESLKEKLTSTEVGKTFYNSLKNLPGINLDGYIQKGVINYLNEKWEGEVEPFLDTLKEEGFITEEGKIIKDKATEKAEELVDRREERDVPQKGRIYEGKLHPPPPEDPSKEDPILYVGVTPVYVQDADEYTEEKKKVEIKHVDEEKNFAIGEVAETKEETEEKEEVQTKTLEPKITSAFFDALKEYKELLEDNQVERGELEQQLKKSLPEDVEINISNLIDKFKTFGFLFEKTSAESPRGELLGIDDSIEEYDSYEEFSERETEQFEKEEPEIIDIDSAYQYLKYLLKNGEYKKIGETESGLDIPGIHKSYIKEKMPEFVDKLKEANVLNESDQENYFRISNIAFKDFEGLTKVEGPFEQKEAEVESTEEKEVEKKKKKEEEPQIRSKEDAYDFLQGVTQGELKHFGPLEKVRKNYVYEQIEENIVSDMLEAGILKEQDRDFKISDNITEYDSWEEFVLESKEEDKEEQPEESREGEQKEKEARLETEMEEQIKRIREEEQFWNWEKELQQTIQEDLSDKKIRDIVKNLKNNIRHQEEILTRAKELEKRGKVETEPEQTRTEAKIDRLQTYINLLESKKPTADKKTAREVKEGRIAEKEEKPSKKEVQKARETFVEAKRKLEEAESGKFFGLFKDEQKIERAKDKLNEAKQEYFPLRAEYVGDEIDKELDERIELINERIQQKLEAEGLLKKGWRKIQSGLEWMSSINLTNAVKKEKKNKQKEKSKLKKTAKLLGKMVSLRSASTIGLTAGGVALGATGTGAGLLATAASMRLAGGADFTYDLLRKSALSKREKEGLLKDISEDDLKNLSREEIKDKQQMIEAQAITSGKSSLQESDYFDLYEKMNEELKERADGRADKIEEYLDQAQQREAGVEAAAQELSAEKKRHAVEAAAAGGVLVAAQADRIFDVLAGEKITTQTAVEQGVEEQEFVTAEEVSEGGASHQQAGPASAEGRAPEMVASYTESLQPEAVGTVEKGEGFLHAVNDIQESFGKHELAEKIRDSHPDWALMEDDQALKSWRIEQAEKFGIDPSEGFSYEDFGLLSGEEETTVNLVLEEGEPELKIELHTDNIKIKDTDAVQKLLDNDSLTILSKDGNEVTDVYTLITEAGIEGAEEPATETAKKEIVKSVAEEGVDLNLLEDPYEDWVLEHPDTPESNDLKQARSRLMEALETGDSEEVQQAKEKLDKAQQKIRELYDSTQE